MPTDDAEPTYIRLPIDGTSVMVEARTVGAHGGEREVAASVSDPAVLTEAVKKFAMIVADALKDVGPDRYAVEFGCELAIEGGGLVALIARGSAKSTLKVTLEWARA